MGVEPSSNSGASRIENMRRSVEVNGRAPTKRVPGSSSFGTNSYQSSTGTSMTGTITSNAKPSRPPSRSSVNGGLSSQASNRLEGRTGNDTRRLATRPDPKSRPSEGPTVSPTKNRVLRPHFEKANIQKTASDIVPSLPSSNMSSNMSDDVDSGPVKDGIRGRSTEDSFRAIMTEYERKYGMSEEKQSESATGSTMENSTAENASSNMASNSSVGSISSSEISNVLGSGIDSSALRSGINADNEWSSKALCAGLGEMRDRIRSLHQQYETSSKDLDKIDGALDSENHSYQKPNSSESVIGHQTPNNSTNSIEASAVTNFRAPIGVDDPLMRLMMETNFAGKAELRGSEIADPNFDDRNLKSVQNRNNVMEEDPVIDVVQCPVASSAADFMKEARTSSSIERKSLEIRRSLAGKNSTPASTADAVASLFNFLDEIDNVNEDEMKQLESVSEAVEPLNTLNSPTNGATNNSPTTITTQSVNHPSLADWNQTKGVADPSRIDPNKIGRVSGLVEDKMSLLDLELADKRKTIFAVKAALEEQKRITKRAVEKAQQQAAAQLEQQRREGEQQMERQLGLCDRLLKEKTELTKKISALAEEMKLTERKFQVKIDENDETHSKEVTRLKNNWITAEKLRRETWEKEKTREIKELTIKGLEPEVERILANHRVEKKRLEERCSEEKEELKVELDAKHQRRIKELQDKHEVELAKVHEKEREKGHFIISEESCKFEKLLVEERRKCAEDLREAEKLWDRKKQEIDRGWEERLQEERMRERRLFDDKAEAQERKIQLLNSAHAEALETWEKRLEEKMKSEKTRVEQEYEVRLQSEKKQLREELERDRDAQVQMITTKLGKETLDIERKFNSKLEQEKKTLWDTLSKDQESLHRKFLESVSEKDRAQQECNALRNEKADLENKLQAKSLNADDLKVKLDDANRELQVMKNASMLEGEEHDRKRASDRDEYKRKEAELRKEISELNAHKEEGVRKYQQLLREQQQQEAESIGNLENRVKTSLKKKDDQIADLKSKLQSKESQLEEMQFLFQRQREDLLGKFAVVEEM